MGSLSNIANNSAIKRSSERSEEFGWSEGELQRGEP